MDIVVTYCEDWDSPLKTSKHHYLKRLARDGHRVLYVEMPSNPIAALKNIKQFFSQKYFKIKAGVLSVEDNVWIMTGFFPFPFHPRLGKLFDNLVVNQINQQVMVHRLKAAIKQLAFDSPTLISYYPTILPVVNQLNFSRIIFHMVDEWQGLAGIPKSLAILTRKMLKKADHTLVTSRPLFDTYAAYTKQITLLRHGSDLKLFESVCCGGIEKDRSITGLGDRVVGYYGALHKLDFNIIQQVAEAKPDWAFVFLGPLSGDQGFKHARPLTKNVVFLEARPREELPSFVASIDAFWMPFEKNLLSENMCPIKIYEGLSAGLPIVCTNLAECRNIGGDKVSFALLAHEHISALESAIDTNSVDKQKDRMAFVSPYDWESRYKEFLSVCMPRLEMKGE